MGSPNAKKTGSWYQKTDPEVAAHNDFVPVWRAKIEQVIMKARMVLANDPQSIAMVNQVAKDLKIK